MIKYTCDEVTTALQLALFEHHSSWYITDGIRLESEVISTVNSVARHSVYLSRALKHYESRCITECGPICDMTEPVVVNMSPQTRQCWYKSTMRRLI